MKLVIEAAVEVVIGLSVKGESSHQEKVKSGQE